MTDAEDRRRLIEARLSGKLGRTGSTGIAPVGRDGRLPLSFAQRRLWFLDQLVPGTSAYNIPAAYRLAGPLDVLALEAAVSDVVTRHEVLRTTFAVADDDGEPYQVIAAAEPVTIGITDLSEVAPDEREDEVARVVAEEAVRPFDLAVGPLLRVSLLRLGAEEHVLLVTMHHVCADGWSLGVFNAELASAYATFASGASSSGLASPAVQYADFAVWQRARLTGELLDTHLGYWRERLAGAPPALELPLDWPRPPLPTFDAGVVGFSVPPEVMAGLREVCRSQRATLFMGLLAAFQGVLSRLSGEDDVVVGSPAAGRDQVETEALIGFFVNTLVLRTDCSGDPSFAELVARARETALGAYAHQDLPFEQLVEHVAPRRDLSRNPLVQVLLHLVEGGGRTAMPNLGAAGDTEATADVVRISGREVGVGAVGSLVLPGVRVGALDVVASTTRFDLEVHVSDQGVGWLLFNRALFDEGSVRGWAAALERVLGVVAGDPGLRLSGWPVVSDVDRELAAGWADGGAAAPAADRSLVEVFAGAAGRWPERVAVVDVDGVEVSFAGLSARAAAVASRLRELGVGPEAVVGVCLERSVDLWAGVLGVLGADAAYLPLDPGLPGDRVALMLEEAASVVVVTSAASAGLLPAGVTPVLVEELPRTGVWPQRCADAGSLAYVIFTSGSTGRPKGIAMSHGPVVNLLGWQTARQGPAAGSRTLQFSAVSFDISIQEVFSTWAAGGAVVLVADDDRADPAALAKLVVDAGVARLFVPPLVLEQLADTAIVTAVTEIATAGDQLQLGEGIRGWLPDGVVVENHYGPSEAHVVTALRLEGNVEDWPVLPSIGTPIAGVRVEIVDEWLQPVPVGVTGEILVGGPHLARGYVGRPGLTGASFVPDEGGGRRYRTGDLGRWRPEGSIEFLGRADFQVKVRGYRIEPGEIEAQLLAHPAVTETVVIAAPDPAGDRRLIAYLTTTGDAAPSTSELRGHLRQRLPDYMIPAQFIVLDAFPLTTAGKLDRSALPEPDGTRPTLDRPYQAPATPTETLLTTIWADVLDLDTIGVLDDFFDLGGHSLLATQITARIRTTFQTDLPLRTIFETPTITDLATTIDALDRSPLPPIEPVGRDGNLPLSFAQRRLWFLDQLVPGSPAYNIPAAYRLTGPLDRRALELAVTEVVARHEALRTTFTFSLEDGEPYQVIAPAAPVAVAVTDLTDATDPDQREAEVLRFVAEQSVRPFDLSSGPMLRVALLRLDAEHHVLVVTMHHICSDGWSLTVFNRELAVAYAAYASGAEASGLAPIPVQYADVAAWQRRWLDEEALAGHVDYWRERLAGAPPALELPTDRPRPPFPTFDAGVVEFTLPLEVLAALQRIGRDRGATLFMVLLAAFQGVLSRLTGDDDVVVGSPIAGRDQVETEALIGFFVNTLVLRTDCSGDPTFAELVGRTRETALGAYAHQALPFEQLVEHVAPRRDLSRNPLVQVWLHLVDAAVVDMTMAGLDVELVGPAQPTTRFDVELHVATQPDGLHGWLVHNVALFDHESAATWTAGIVAALTALAAAPELPLSQWPLVPPADQERLIAWAGGDLPRAPSRPGLLARIGAHAAAAPDRVAIVEPDGTPVTYGELVATATAIADQLGGLGVGAGDAVVGVCLERSAAMVASILGVVAAGAAYVPLDPDHPVDRLAYVLEDSGARAVVSRHSLAGRLPDHLPVVDVEDVPATPAAPPAVPVPGQLAYVVYTSGSTGAPKGVAVAHDSLANLVDWHVARYDVGPDDVCTLVASTTFDASVWELWPPLVAGARLVLAPSRSSDLASDAGQWLDAAGATVAFLPTPMAELLLATEWKPTSVRALLTGGDVLHAPPGRRSHVAVHNHYGPTECTVVATATAAIDQEDWPLLPAIGAPIDGVRAHIVDEWLQPVPIGILGEIVLGGGSVARGYIGRPGATAGAFVPDSLDPAGGRLYRTGDVGRWRRDGTIEYLGRADLQVKVRGFRIEPAEVEVALLQHPGIAEAVVAALQDPAGDRRLVGFVVATDEPPTTSELRAHLRQRLPDYMIPSQFVVLDELPHGTSGKVDRAALPTAGSERPLLDRPYVAPRTPEEEIVASAWSDVLGLERVGVDDDFFELGGHSLLAIQLISRLRDTFDLEIPLSWLFEYPTIGELTEAIEEMVLDELEGLSDDEVVAVLEQDDER